MPAFTDTDRREVVASTVDAFDARRETERATVRALRELYLGDVADAARDARRDAKRAGRASPTTRELARVKLAVLMGE